MNCQSVRFLPSFKKVITINFDHGTGGRLENQDWFENDDTQDMLVHDLYNTSEAFQPSVSTLKRIIRGKLSALLPRMYVARQHMYEIHVHGMSLNVFSSPVQIICEKGTKF